MALELYGVSDIDGLAQWAKLNGLYQYNNEFIDCYKSVITIESDGVLRYFSSFKIFTNPFEWFPWSDEIVECEEIDTDPRHECSCGLYGTSFDDALHFLDGLYDVSILKLRVPLDDNIIVVPFGRFGGVGLTNKFRFKKCQVLNADIGKTRLTVSDKTRIINAAVKLRKELNSDGHRRLLRDLHGV